MMVDLKEKQNKNLLPALFVMAQVQYLWHKGNSFTESCLQIENLDSKVVLSTLAIELLVKSSIAAEICLHNINGTEDQINNLIDRKFKSISHNFKKIFNESQTLKEKMDIEGIERVNHTGFVDEFRIKLSNEEFPLLFKTLEASRYGAFSSNKDFFIFANRQKEDNFLKELAMVTFEKIRSTYVQLNKYF